MSVAMEEDFRPVLHVPPVFRPVAENLLFWVEKALDASPEDRRRLTRNEPLLFGLVYFPHHLQSAETGGRYSLNQMHIDMAEEATNWRYQHGPQEYRCAWVGPRYSGKTTWNFSPGILPIWAMAHGWRTCLLLLADSGDRAEQHFRGIRREFNENKLLRLDYPELCTPARDADKVGIDTKTEYLSMGGHSIAAKGMDAKVLGFKEYNQRPDLMVIDDVEPTGTKYSTNMKQKRLLQLIDMVFAMNLNAVVVLVGTVTRFGSILHEVVQAAAGGTVAEWIQEENIRCRYYPAIVLNEEQQEESFWEVRWPYEWMQKVRKTRTFQLNYMNMPLSQGKGFWHVTDFLYNAPWLIDSEVLSIDPAVKSQEVNDYTGLAIIGFDAAKIRALVKWAEGVRLDPHGTRELIKWIFVNNPKIDTVVIETNNGGDYVVNSLKPVIPRGVRVINKHETVPKMERIRQLHDWHQLGWIWHAPGLISLEQQELAYPDVDHDDIVDAVAKGAAEYLSLRPIPQPA